MLIKNECTESTYTECMYNAMTNTIRHVCTCTVLLYLCVMTIVPYYINDSCDLLSR